MPYNKAADMAHRLLNENANPTICSAAVLETNDFQNKLPRSTTWKLPKAKKTR